MSISTCPQPSGRLLALWLFAKHQQAFKEVTVDIMSNVSAFLEAMAAPPMTGRPDRAAAAKPRNRAENARASGRASGVRDSAGPGPTRRLRNPTGPLPNARASPPTALGGGTSYCCRCSTVWGPPPILSTATSRLAVSWEVDRACPAWCSTSTRTPRLWWCGVRPRRAKISPASPRGGGAIRVTEGGCSRSPSPSWTSSAPPLSPTASPSSTRTWR